MTEERLYEIYSWLNGITTLEHEVLELELAKEDLIKQTSEDYRRREISINIRRRSVPVPEIETLVPVIDNIISVKKSKLADLKAKFEEA